MSCFQPVLAHAEDTWAWIQSSSIPDGWDLRKGKATVHIEGKSFTAELFDEADALLIKMNGTIQGNRLKVRTVTQNADYGSSEMSGELKSRKWKGFADTIGRQTITLSDGWNLIGLTRELKPDKKAHR